MDAEAVSTPIKTNRDFSKIINPSMKTLSSWEAKLILGVLDECINQMDVAVLQPNLLNCPEELSLSLGEEVLRTLTEHQRLEEKHQSIIVDGSPDQSELKELQTKSGKAVQDSFRKIIRMLRATPTTKEELKQLETKTPRELGCQKIRNGLCELRDVVLERLLTTAGEERERKEMMLEVSQRHTANQKLLDAVEKEVAMANKDKDVEISTLNNKVYHLRNSLHQMEKGLEEFVIRTQQDAEKQSQSDKNTSEGKRSQMQQEASQLKTQLENVIAANREIEMDLRKKKYKDETEIENLIQKYDAEMGEKQTELEEMTCMHEKDQLELRELEELFKVLDLEYSQIMEERRKAEELRKKLEKERQIQTQAAIVIQAHWKGFSLRKAMKASAKPKKGKKGKGKKGK